MVFSKRSKSPDHVHASTQDDDPQIPSAKKHRIKEPLDTPLDGQMSKHSKKKLPPEQVSPPIVSRIKSPARREKPTPTQTLAKAIAKRSPVPASKSESSTLPKMVSPTLPGGLNYTLPPLLSPTLPPEIEEILAEAQRQRPTSRQRSTGGSRSARAGSSPQPPSKRTKTNGETRRVDRGIREDESKQGPGKKPSKWITLRMHRGKLARILKGATKAPVARHEPLGRRNEPSSHQRPPSRSSALDKIRSVEVLRNSAKAVNGSNTPATPAAMASSPPGPSTPSGRDIRQQTGVTSSSMHRGGSSQGMTAPSVTASRNATPSSPVRPDVRAEYQVESERLSRLGRDLKHASDVYLKPDKVSMEDRHRGVVIATESCLIFVLAAAVLDEPPRREGQATSKNSMWPSLLPFLSQIKAAAEPFPHLQGLLFQLEAVIRDTINYNITHKLHNFLREATAPNEGQQRLLRDLTDNTNRARKAWRDGMAKLRLHDLIQFFPASWAKARTDPSRGKGADGVILGNFSADGFALPMTVSTTGIEAANAGMSILTEYCERESVEWKPKLMI